VHTILLVEDDVSLRKGIRRLLERAGYAVLTAATSTEAMERAADRNVTIDLLVTDVVLPGVTGRQVAEVLQRARPGLRVLYISGYDESDLSAQGNVRPGDAFLQKPFAVEALLRRVRALLEPEQGRDAASGSG
jgi:two-component system cell cycle sensor histidine kinase/response regulator CckA